MKHYNYDDKALYENFPFKIKDVEVSSILYVANKILSYIADLIGEDSGEILEWTSNKGSANSDILFYDYDLIIKDRIFKKTVSSFPLSSGLVSIQEAKVLVKWLSEPDFCAMYDTIASTDEKESYFKPVTYWRGPIWINTNWALWLGLLRYGYIERAELIRQGVFKLVQNQGFREYYEPTTGFGLGGKNFSWTAALVIDMIKMKSLPFSELWMSVCLEATLRQDLE